jgi:hypothetical protein
MVDRPLHRFLRLVFALASVHLLIMGAAEVRRGIDYHQQTQLLRVELQQLRGKVASLQEEVRLGNDPQYLDSLVRGLGLVRKDETLVPFSPQEALP